MRGDSAGNVVAVERRPHAEDHLQLTRYPRSLYAVWASENGNRDEAWREQRKYDQIPAHRGLNNWQCASGCGPTAWAMLFGWADYEAARNRSPWTPFKGLFKKGGGRSGPDAVAPEWFWPTQANRLSIDRGASQPIDAGAQSMIHELKSYLNDWAAAGCAADGGRWTAPHIMAQVVQYFKGRAGVSLSADYDGLGVMTAKGKQNAAGSIQRFHRPVIIGIGHFAHYPLAFGIVRDTFAIYNGATGNWAPPATFANFVDNGHQEAWAQYVPYDTWFAG